MKMPLILENSKRKGVATYRVSLQTTGEKQATLVFTLPAPIARNLELKVGEEAEVILKKLSAHETGSWEQTLAAIQYRSGEWSE